MNDTLSKDEYDALAQIVSAVRSARPSACIARNVKRLTGLKFVAYGKDGSLQITDKGKQTLYIRRCIDGLRAVLQDPLVRLDDDVQALLCRKGHLAACIDTGGYAVTQRGRESLIDIDAMQS